MRADPPHTADLRHSKGGGKRAAIFSIPARSHFQPLRPLISDLVRHGIDAHVFTDARFAAEVESAGGTFVDLYGPHPVEAVDGESIPVPSRYVSFAAAYADEVAARVAKLEPQLIVYDSFAVIGHVVGRMLGVPYLAVHVGHNENPVDQVRELQADGRVSISATCHRAAATLRGQYGVPEASPFSYLNGLSPYLNIYSEPPAFLSPEERRPFEPLAFYGCLPSLEDIGAIQESRDRDWFDREMGGFKVYVSFGTVVTGYWPREVLEALECIAGTIAELPDVRGLISLSGAELEPERVRALSRPNVSVFPYVDQWRVLGEANLYITHQGINSTHEAIFNCVPMLAYPFFGDQPALAAKCEQFGLSIRLSDVPRGPLTRERVRASIDEARRRAPQMRAALAEAREWEVALIADRGSALRQIEELIAASPGCTAPVR